MNSHDEIARKYNIETGRLVQYERAGILSRAIEGRAYDSELKVSIIVKAERLGFTFEEIVMLCRTVAKL